MNAATECSFQIKDASGRVTSVKLPITVNFGEIKEAYRQMEGLSAETYIAIISNSEPLADTDLPSTSVKNGEQISVLVRSPQEIAAIDAAVAAEAIMTQMQLEMTALQRELARLAPLEKVPALMRSPQEIAAIDAVVAAQARMTALQSELARLAPLKRMINSRI